MPFISEEIYHHLREQTIDLCVQQLTPPAPTDASLLLQGNLLKNVITNLRDARNKNQLKPKETIKLHIQTAQPEGFKAIEGILFKQVNAESIAYSSVAIANSIVVAVEKDKFYIESEKQLDSATLKADLLKDLEHQHGFLASVSKKLGNEKFVQNAKPEVLALEQKKKADAEARIKTIEESLAGMN